MIDDVVLICVLFYSCGVGSLDNEELVKIVCYHSSNIFHYGDISYIYLIALKLNIESGQPQ